LAAFTRLYRDAWSTKHKYIYIYMYMQYMMSIKLVHALALACHHQESSRTKESKSNMLI